QCCAAAAGANSSSCSCLRVVSLATGNKCVGRDKIPDDGSVVHDSHAEVLARRALLLRLWRELHLRVSSTAGQQQDTTVGEHKAKPATNSGRSDGRSTPSLPTAATVDANPQPPLYGGVLPGEDDGNILLLERSPQAANTGASTPWRLKPHVRLHLYISDAPCGDASIYEQKRQGPQVGGGGSARCSVGDGDRGNDSSFWGGVPHSASPAGGRSDGERRGRGGDDRGDAKRPRCAVATAGLSDAAVPPLRPGLPLDEELSCSAASLNPLGCKTAAPEVKVGEKLAGQGESLSAETMTFTGAKIIAAVKERGAPDRSFSAYRNEEGGKAATADLVLRIDREQEQQVGALRIKSSRSNISEEGRTMSMSCSDKLAKWAFLGVQGGLLASWVEPIFLSSIVISADPRTDGPAPLASALMRAIPGRAALAKRRLSCDSTAGTVGGEEEKEHLSHPPLPREEEEEEEERMAVFVSEVAFARSKAQSEQRVLDEAAACSSTSGVGSPDSIPPAKATVSSVEASPLIADASVAAGPAGQRIPGHNERSGRETSQGTRLDNHHSGKRSRRDRNPKKVVPSGTSLNWIEGLGTGRGTGPGGGDAARVQAEVTLSATGRMQGAVSKGVLTLRTRSRLCRARLLEAANVVARAYLPQRAPMCDHHHNSDVERTGEQAERVQAGEGTSGDEGSENGGRSYWRLKQASGAYRVRREAMLSTPTFRAWLVGGKDKQRFAVDERTGVVPLAQAPASQPPTTRS
ncbi:unnamed protein product, partial [Ectocarpus fasciculatus]